MERQRLYVFYSGRVQGVGFRWFVREEARALDLSGWVMNRPDGCVEVAAEGPEPALSAMRALLAKGPPSAHVSAVEDLEPVREALPKPFGVHR